MAYLPPTGVPRAAVGTGWLGGNVGVRSGDPKADTTTMGSVVNKIQWEKIQGLIKKGIDEGPP
jgi:acyl-CoA reductase-like NAD-dependent aldehyde dehydrogenase